MNNYFISKDNKSGEIVYLEYDKEGYKVTPKRKKEDAIEVNKIVFVSPKLTEKLIKKKIDHKLDKLLYELNLINIDDEDNDSGNSEKIRDMLKEAEKFRLSIINNYKKYLGNSYITLTLKKMQIMKISEMRMINGGNNQLDNANDEPGTLLPQNPVSIRR